MKNMLGLAIALSLALVAALLNWKYLDRKSQELETISFLAVNEGTRIRPGDTFLDTHFTSVEIPKKQVGQLKDTAVLYEDRHTVISIKAANRYDGGEIILRQDLKTRQTELPQKAGEAVIWIPVDPNSFVPSLVKPGDMVSFIVPKGVDYKQPPDEGPLIDPEVDENTSPQDGFPDVEPVGSTTSFGQIEKIGPFRILALGERLGSDEVHRASGAGRSRENLMAISVKTEKNGEFEPRVKKLYDRLQSTRQVGVVLENELE